MFLRINYWILVTLLMMEMELWLGDTGGYYSILRNYSDKSQFAYTYYPNITPYD